jgi:hypothetical protein
MRFKKGVGYQGPRWPRGRGRGNPPYQMSRAAYDARLHNLRCVKKRKRTYGESRRNELEVALWTHKPEDKRESLRTLARRVGLSHVYCWKVARNYRNGLIPLLPDDEAGLLELRDSLDQKPVAAKSPAAHGWECSCKTCICPRCGRRRGPRDPAGKVLESWERCQCVEHPKDCGCAGCQIERAIAAAQRSIDLNTSAV